MTTPKHEAPKHKGELDKPVPGDPVILPAKGPGDRGVKDEPATPVVIQDGADAGPPTTVGGRAVHTKPVPAQTGPIGPPYSPEKWVVNLASPKGITMPEEKSPYTTLVIVEDVELAKEEAGFGAPKKGAKDKDAAKDAPGSKADQKLTDEKRKNLEAFFKGAEKSTKERRERYKDDDKKKHKKARRKADSEEPDTISFLLRHSPAWCSIVEVECAETVEEARDLVLRLLPACSLEQITEIDPAPMVAIAK